MTFATIQRCRLSVLGVVSAVLALSGCGTPSADLFEVERSGADPNANLRMLVSDGGTVRCDGKRHPLDAPRLLRARELARELAAQAELGLELPPGPGTQLSYRVRLAEGTVAFSDQSPGVPRELLLLAAYTKDVAERVCGIDRR